MTTPSLTTLLIQRARQTSELQSYGQLTTPYVKILLRALSDRLELAEQLVRFLVDNDWTKNCPSNFQEMLQRYTELSALPPDNDLPTAEGLQTLEERRPATFEEVWASTGYQYSEDALESVRLGWRLAHENHPSPQSPTAPAGEDAAHPVQLVTPGESILDAYERARHSYETASPARIDYDLRKAEFQNLHVDMVSRLQRVGLIDALRAGEGDSVTIFCDNADFEGPDNAVEVSGQWTEWEDRRFEGATLNQALTKALLAKGQADAKG